jgi:hypothetical protein
MGRRKGEEMSGWLIPYLTLDESSRHSELDAL